MVFGLLGLIGWAQPLTHSSKKDKPKPNQRQEWRTMKPNNKRKQWRNWIVLLVCLSGIEENEQTQCVSLPLAAIMRADHQRERRRASRLDFLVVGYRPEASLAAVRSLHWNAFNSVPFLAPTYLAGRHPNCLYLIHSICSFKERWSVCFLLFNWFALPQEWMEKKVNFFGMNGRQGPPAHNPQHSSINQTPWNSFAAAPALSFHLFVDWKSCCGREH